MKNIFKNLKIVIASCLMMISGMNLTVLTAAGGTLTYGASTGVSYTTSGPALEGGMRTDFSANSPQLILNGHKVVFCVDPSTIAIDGGNGYEKSDFYDLKKVKKWNLMAYHGYYTHGKAMKWYMASQFMIWEDRGWKIDSTNLSDYATMKAQIQDAIDHHYDKPSFDGTTKTVNVGSSITLTDTNKVLSEFTLSDVKGVTITKSGDKVTITPTTSAPDSFKLTGNRYTDGKDEASIVYRTSGNSSQAVGDFGYSDPAFFNVTINVNKHGSLKIAKNDEDGTAVPNTSFKVSKNSDMSSPIGTYKTGADGTVTIDELLPDTYYVQETAVPNHLVLDTTVRTVSVEANKTATLTVQNNWVKGKIQLKKIDPQSKKQVAGATYAIYNDKGQELERLVTKATGYVESGYLRFGEYTVREVIAPSGYILNKTSYPVTIATNEQKITVTGEDERQTGRLEITKEDSVTGSAAQGEATLKGAVYELKAKENILDPADGSVKYAKDAVVATLTTDANAKASVSDLYLGKYVLQEKTASTGYTLDTTKYDISIAYAGQSVEVVTKKQTVKERVKAQAFSIIKISDNGSGEADKLAGVEFTVKSQKDIDAYGTWEKAPVAKNAQGKTAAILVTDNNGYAVSEELPYGQYVVRETKVPDDLYKVPDFKVTVSQDSRDPQPWRIFNDEKFRAVVKAVKVDQETGKTIALAGTTFKIKNLDKNEYVEYWEWSPVPHKVNTWTTDESGTVMTGKELDPGRYALEEISAPDGYILNVSPIEFRVSMNTAYETLPDGSTPVITVTKQNTSVKGRVNVSKEGEVLIKAEPDDNGNTKFKYENRKLKDAVFEVYADEDILSADNQGDVLYHKDDLVDTITTSADGEAQSKLLPLGKYRVSEKTAPSGFTHSNDIKKVELTYKDQNTAIVFGDAGTYENERQRVDVQAVKKDADDQQLLAGAEITLYANRDVYNYDGDVIVKAGEQIETVVTGEDGKATFTADLPNDLTPEYGVMPIEEIEDEDLDPGFGVNVIDGVRLIGDPNSLFYAGETKAPQGYASGQEVRYYFDTKYTDQDEAVLKFESEFQNESTKVEISKVDITNEKELPGATLQIKTEDGKIIEEWVSTDNPHMFEKLPVGKYVLSEKLPAAGYTTAEDIPFEIKDTGEIQKIIMKDDITKLQIIKTDEEGKLLPGNKLAIIDQNGKTVDEWITDDKPHDITKLIVGQEYILRELEAAAGYTKAADVAFTVRDTNEIQTVNMNNKQTVMHFSKVDETGEKELPGAKLQITDEDGNIIDQWTSTEEQHTITGLTEGQKYVMIEISAPYGYEIAEKIEFTAGDGQKVVMKDKMIRVSVVVNKVDSVTKENIKSKNFEFTMYKDAECTQKIETVQADKEQGTATFANIPFGTVWIKETKAPLGYKLSKEIKEVVIDENTPIVDGVYSFEYVNVLMPTIVVKNEIKTGDTTSVALLFTVSGIAGFAAYLMIRKRRDLNRNDN